MRRASRLLRLLDAAVCRVGRSCCVGRTQARGR